MHAHVNGSTTLGEVKSNCASDARVGAGDEVGATAAINLHVVTRVHWVNESCSAARALDESWSVCVRWCNLHVTRVEALGAALKPRRCEPSRAIDEPRGSAKHGRH
jgi:hypothetical protein